MSQKPPQLKGHFSIDCGPVFLPKCLPKCSQNPSKIHLKRQLKCNANFLPFGLDFGTLLATQLGGMLALSWPKNLSYPPIVSNTQKNPTSGSPGRSGPIGNASLGSLKYSQPNSQKDLDMKKTTPVALKRCGGYVYVYVLSLIHI